MTALPHIFSQISVAINRRDIKTAEKLLNSIEKTYKNDPNFLFEKGMIENLKGSNQTQVVLPLFEKAYNSGLQNDLNFLRVYGALLAELERFSTAAEIIGKIVMTKKDDIEAFINLAHVFEKTGNPITAINTLKMALKVNPNHHCIPSLYCNMASALMEGGYQEEAFESYKKAIEYDSKNILFASNFLFSFNYVDISRQEQFEYYQKYRTLWENEIPNARPSFPDTEKIKIGFVSGDLYMHAVSFFISSLFECYDRSRFEIHLFARVKKFDGVSQQFKDLTDKWHDITLMNFRDVAKIVKKEKITVLVDLSGHTGKNCLTLFGMRPAPLQVTYCGYPNTTGLKSIDYRISDNICEPEDAQNFHSEKLFKISDCFLCYQPHFTQTSPCKFESLQGRPVIFGSFNNLQKMTKRTIKLWCKVVNAVPDSKLVIKHRYLNDPKLRQITLSRFAENGLPAERITIFDFNFENKDHFEQYNKIDIALDSFPYNGTTTTCEALFMGVPVITILGDRHCSRVSASLLNAVGLGELAAKNEEEFVKIAADLAKDVEKLTKIKQNLRENMQKSPLMNKEYFTQRWQNAILDMIAEVKKERENA